MFGIIKQRLSRLDSFLRTVLWLGGGATASQFFFAVSLPILARLYEPAELGILAMFMAVVTLLHTFFTLRYELAIPLPEDNATSGRLLLLSNGSATVGSTLFALLLFWNPNCFMSIVNLETVQGVSWMLPIGIGLAAINQSFYFYLVRQRLFPTIAVSRTCQAITTVLFQLVFSKYGITALIGGQLIGQLVAMLILLSRSKEAFHGVNRLSDMYYAAVRYKKFPQYYLWSGLISSFSLQTPLIILSHYFGATAVGYYALAYRVLSSPLSPIGQSIGHAYLSAVIQQRRSLREITFYIYNKQVDILIPICLLLCIIGSEITTFLLGDSWETTGILLQWMAPFIVLSFIATPLTELFTILEKQHISTLYQTLLLIVRIVSLLLGVQTGNLVYTIAVFSLGNALLWLCLIIFLFRISGNEPKKMLYPIRRFGWWVSIVPFALLFKISHNHLLSAAMFFIMIVLLFIYMCSIARKP
jgi:O-antigen/teichoic acid export membrane protein